MLTAERLFNENKDIVYRYAYSVLWNKEDAEDITSQTFLTALKKIDQAQKYPKQSTWLIAIARNHIGNLWQKKRLAPLPDNPGEDEQHWEDLAPDTSAQSQLEEMVKGEDGKRVLEALAQLSPMEREIVTLKLWDEWKHNEIARIVNLAKPTVKIYYRRAITKLYEILKPKDKKQWSIYFLALGQMKEYSQFKAGGSLVLPTNITNSVMFKSTISKVLFGLGTVVVVSGIIGGAVLWQLRQPSESSQPSPTPTPLVTTMITSTPTESPIPTVKPALSANWQEQKVTVDYREYGGWQLQFTMKLPKGAKISRITSPPTFPGVRITDGGTTLSLVIPYEAYPYRITKHTALKKHAQWGTWYRINHWASSAPSVYSTFVTLKGTCDGPTPLSAPCGVADIGIEQYVGFRAVCEKTDDEYATCDEIMKLLTAKKAN